MNTQDLSRSPSRPRRGAAWLLWLLVLGAVAIGTWWGSIKAGWLSTSKTTAVRGVEVARGPLRISVTERGNLKAADSVSLKSEIEGQTTILFLIPEGSHVKQGDLLVELDATSLVDKKVQQEISVRNAEAAFVKSKQNYDIQVSQNESDIAKAEQELDFARQDLRKFQESDRDLQRKAAEEEIALKEEEFARAREKLAWSEKLAEKGFLTATELEADRLNESRARILRDQSERELKQKLEFEFPRQVAELEGNLAEAQRELERVKLQSAAKLVDFDADLKTNQAKLDLEREKLSKLDRQIAKARIVAPKGGMVVYSKQEEGGGRFSQAQPIAEGTSVRERQEIVTIPNAGGMIAQASVHESVLKQVKVGQTCLLKIDSLPGQEFQGRVQFVALLPDQNSWWANPNSRVYRTDVVLSAMHPEMRPGMSCSVEILVEDILDTLYVPVQAVFRHEAKNIAFVVTPDGYRVADVQIGQYNEKWVQVLSGLKQGEQVLMAPPEGFKLNPTAASEAGFDGAASPESGPAQAGPVGPASPTGNDLGAGPGSAEGAREGGTERPRRGDGQGRRGGEGFKAGASAQGGFDPSSERGGAGEALDRPRREGGASRPAQAPDSGSSAPKGVEVNSSNPSANAAQPQGPAPK